MEPSKGPPIQSYGFDLSETPARNREAFWRQRIGQFELRDLPPQIEARGCGWDLGQVVLTDTVHPRQTFVRDKARLRRDGVDHLLVSVELTAGFEMETDRGQETVPVGRVTVFDVARPAIKVAAAGRTLCMAVSRDLMEEVLPGVNLHGLTLGPAGTLMTEHLRSLSAHLHRTELAAAPHIARATVQLLAACTMPSPARLERARPALAYTLLQRAKRYIRANCHDPDLSPDTVAVQIGASRTSLYRAFQPEGGVSEFIRMTRLDAARSALSDPTDGRRIGEIGFAHGFSSEAQFSRAMRAAYGAAPSELRRERHGFRSGLSPENWARRGWRKEAGPEMFHVPMAADGDNAGRVIHWRRDAAAGLRGQGWPPFEIGTRRREAG